MNSAELIGRAVFAVTDHIIAADRDRRIQSRTEGHVSAMLIKEGQPFPELVCHVTGIRWDPNYNRLMIELGDLGPTNP